MIGLQIALIDYKNLLGALQVKAKSVIHSFGLYHAFVCRMLREQLYCLQNVTPRSIRRRILLLTVPGKGLHPDWQFRWC